MIPNMKLQRLFGILLCLAFCRGAFAQAQDMDKELSDLTEKLATKIQAVGKKKITVLDFTDLDGATSDLGKYVAEQLTVTFVTGDRKFVVVDRANLKKILAEHKLTASGLIDPENAKKLSTFSGVDAIILGTVVPMTPNIKLTAKIITTDTADIVGGGLCSFKADENVQKLLARTTSQSQSNGNADEPKKPKPQFVKSIGDLSVIFESLKGLQSYSASVHQVMVNLIFTNSSSAKTIAVALYADPSGYLSSSLVGADGTKWRSDGSNLTGLRALTALPKNLVAIEPGNEVKASVVFQTSDAMSDSLNSMRLQTEVVINADYKESQYDNFRPSENSLPPYCKIVNVTFDIPIIMKPQKTQ